MQAVQAAAEKTSETATQALNAATKGYAAVNNFFSKTSRDGARLFRKTKPDNETE